MCELLLENKCDTKLADVKGNTPAHVAAEKGAHNLLKVLLKYKADVLLPNLHGDSPLHIAAKLGHQDCAKLLMEHAKSRGSKNKLQQSSFANQEGLFPPHLAAIHGRVKCLSTLLDNGYNVDCRSVGSERTPLLFAASHSQAQCMTELMERVSARTSGSVGMSHLPPARIAHAHSYTDTHLDTHRHTHSTCTRTSDLSHTPPCIQIKGCGWPEVPLYALHTHTHTPAHPHARTHTHTHTRTHAHTRRHTDTHST
jgi:ankyrin repeat protein